MNISAVNNSYNPRFNGKLKLMNQKEMHNFLKEYSKNGEEPDFFYKNADDVKSFIYTQLITGDEITVKNIVSFLKKVVMEMPAEQIAKLEKDLNKTDKKFDKTI